MAHHPKPVLSKPVAVWELQIDPNAKQSSQLDSVSRRYQDLRAAFDMPCAAADHFAARRLLDSMMSIRVETYEIEAGEPPSMYLVMDSCFLTRWQILEPYHELVTRWLRKCERGEEGIEAVTRASKPDDEPFPEMKLSAPALEMPARCVGDVPFRKVQVTCGDSLAQCIAFFRCISHLDGAALRTLLVSFARASKMFPIGEDLRCPVTPTFVNAPDLDLEGRIFRFAGLGVLRDVRDELLLAFITSLWTEELIDAGVVEGIIAAATANIQQGAKRQVQMIVGLTVFYIAYFAILAWVVGSSPATNVDYATLPGTIYWRDCSNSSSSFYSGYGGSTALGQSYNRRDYASSSEKWAALAKPTAQLLAAFDSVAGPWYGANTTTCLALAAALLPGVVVTASNCSAALAAGASMLGNHASSLSSISWVVDQSTIMLTVTEQIPVGLTIPHTEILINADGSTHWGGADVTDQSSSLSSTSQSPDITYILAAGFTAGVCYGGTVAFHSTSCVLYNDELAITTPLIFVVLSILRILFMTLLTNLVIMPYIVTPLKRRLRCAATWPLIGGWISDCDLPLWVVDFSVLYPASLRDNRYLEDHVMPQALNKDATVSEFLLPVDTPTFSADIVAKAILNEVGPWVNELVERLQRGDDIVRIDAAVQLRPFLLSSDDGRHVAIALHAASGWDQKNTVANLNVYVAKPSERFSLKLQRLRDQLRFFRFLTSFNNTPAMMFPELRKEPPVFCYHAITAMLSHSQYHLSEESIGYLVPLVASDLWIMSTVQYNPSLPLKAVFSEITVLLHAYFHLSWRERCQEEASKSIKEEVQEHREMLVSWGLTAERLPSEMMVGGDDGMNALPRLDDTHVRPTKSGTSVQLLERLKEICPTINDEVWYHRGVWSFEKGPDDGCREPDTSVEEFVHKMLEKASLPGAVSDKQQRAFHSWSRVTPGPILLLIGWMSTVVCLSTTLLWATRNNSHRLIPLCFQGFSYSSMLDRWWDS